MSVPFILEQVYNVPVEKVWQALTQTDKMKQWYFPQLLHFEPVAGFKFQFEDEGSHYKKEWIVTAVVESRKLAHTWVYKGYPGVSQLSFELFPEGHNTRLKLTHTGLESFPADPHFARHRFEDGWRIIIGNKLKNSFRLSCKFRDLCAITQLKLSVQWDPQSGAYDPNNLSTLPYATSVNRIIKMLVTAVS